ncbi:MAG: rhomboid family intramembrane serine protease [Rikenellaceae bacterium]|nr:rhomboid family intramembrane serine protease [Rikenellaceae bacterium]MDY3893328.1 rhomboid family intramembrane serine protease [Candidatus Cryptobacteroides sp.]
MEIRFRSNSGGFLGFIPPVTRNLIIINTLILIITSFSKNFMYETFALFYPASPFFHWWQPVTHMFMHGGFGHLFFNMFTLYMFGSVLERVWGGKKYLLFYMVTGLGAALLHTGVEWLQTLHWQHIIQTGDPSAAIAATQSMRAMLSTPTVGASGAIYGLLLGYAMLFPDSVMTLIFPPISMKAKWFVLVFAVIELLMGVLGSDGVAHFAHLGGMLFGFILIRIWRKSHKMYSQD